MQYPNRCNAENCASTTVEFEGPCTAEMGNCNCPKTMDKVCGMDDRTYNNECEMKCNNVIMESTENAPAGRSNFFRVLVLETATFLMS